MFIITDNMINMVQYNGSRRKFGISYNGQNYLVKFKHKGWDNVLSEAVASRFLSHCGFLVHQVDLGVYKQEPCVICKDFTSTYGVLETIQDMSSSLDTDAVNHQYFLRDVCYELSKIKNSDTKALYYSFCLMCVADAIVGNPDRHLGNWGTCKTFDDRHVFAPIYDNDASLFPRADKNITISDSWMKERIFTFPNSKIMIGDKRETSNYYDLLRSPEFDSSALSVTQHINVIDAMRRTCIEFGLNRQLSKFYMTVVYYRYTTIVQGKPYIWRGNVQC